MGAQAAGSAERDPPRPRMLAPALNSRRRKAGAAAATAATVGQLAVAPATLALTVVLVATGRLTRWRPSWLALPALTGLGLLVSSPEAALRGFLAGPRALAGGLTAGIGLGQVARGALSAAAVPGQLPLALLAGTAEAGILLWAGSYRPGVRPVSGWRPGALALVKGRVGRATLAAGHTVSQRGCALGLELGTGRLATVSWADFESGLLASAASPAAVIGLCLPAVVAALRRRMAVAIFDLTPQDELTQPVTRLCAALGIGLRSITDMRAPALGHQLLRRECAIGRTGPVGLGALTACLNALSDARIRGDALAWLHGCTEADLEVVAGLAPLGSAAGVRLLFSTCDDAAAASLDSRVATTLTAQADGSCSLRASRARPVRYVAVPLRAVTP